MTATLDTGYRPHEDLTALAIAQGNKVIRLREMIEQGASMQRIVEFGRYHRCWDPAFIRKVLIDLRLSTLQLDAIAPPPAVRPTRTISLHPVQLRILDALCDGHATTELGRELPDVPEHSLRHHLKALPKRMGAANATQAVAWALSGRVRTVEMAV
jgi:DNA-binding NarL/FixJ family response regulator